MVDPAPQLILPSAQICIRLIRSKNKNKQNRLLEYVSTEKKRLQKLKPFE